MFPAGLTKFFEKDREIGGGICGMNMLKQNMREKTGRISRNPDGAVEIV